MYLNMHFIWDEQKCLANIAKHGLDFAQAHKVFDGAYLLFEDTRFDYGEQRFVAIGFLGVLVVVVVHTQTNQTVRIISMRKATKNEQKLYYEQL